MLCPSPPGGCPFNASPRPRPPGQEAVEGETLIIKIDKTAPTVSAVLDAAAVPRTVTITTGDGASGVATTEYRIGDGDWQSYGSAVELDGTAQTLAYRATDIAGNTSVEGSLNVPAAPMEPANPIIALDVTLDPAALNGAGDWDTSAVGITAEGTSTGSDELSYGMSINGVATDFNGSAVIDVEGTSEVVVSTTDGTFSQESETMALQIDTGVPTATASASGRIATLGGSMPAAEPTPVRTRPRNPHALAYRRHVGSSRSHRGRLRDPSQPGQETSFLS